MSIAVNPDFWFGKRVFLTGHTGFKGSWICMWLQSLGAQVHGLALECDTSPNLFSLLQVENGMASHRIGNICDLATVQQVMQSARPDIVIHMAAQALVRMSYAEPVNTYATNVMGTVNVLEAVRHTPSVKAVVVVTTDKCYDNKEWAWGYRENEPMGGHDPYSSSKGCAELITAAYRNSFFSRANCPEGAPAIASARAGNVIGGGDWAKDRLVPDILSAFEQNKPLMIRKPNAIRPWQHVLEPLSGYLKLAEHLTNQGQSFAEAWNFGPKDDDACSVQWIVDYLTSTLGNGATWHLDSDEHPQEANYLKLDISKARTKLNWHPRWDLQYSLDKIVEWQQAFIDKGDMRSVTLNQIASYQNWFKL